MFVRKIIAALLLGIYGIPAAVGPHWHHHEHSHSGSSHSRDVSATGETRAAGGCCGHHHFCKAVAKKASAPQPGLRAAGDPADACNAALCAVCQFYAAAVSQSDERSPLVGLSIVALSAAAHDAPASSPRHSWQGRGPPAAV